MDAPPEYQPHGELDDTMDNLNLSDNLDEPRLIIGIDFGTTYSGLAYAFSTKPEAIYIIDKWPNAGGRMYAKCPTLIAYEADGKSFKWGFEVDRTAASCIEGMKLLLDPDQPKPIYAPSTNTSAELSRLGKRAEDIAADYINALYQYAIKIIESKMPRDYLTILPKQFVLSVPAVWSDKAKDLTRRAARNAGIVNVKVVKEPEAAALFTIHSMGEKGLKVGDALVMCDAGGGTVDLITYEIRSLQPFELAELTIATGGLAGSLILNRRFEEWIEDVVGKQAYLDLREKDCYRLAMKQFEDVIKPEFRSKDQGVQHVVFPMARLEDNIHKGLERDAIAVTGNDLFNIFDPVFREVQKLVTEQVKDAKLKRIEKGRMDLSIKAIFLVGGFGGNTYIYDQLVKAHPQIQVIQPNDAWSAIVRGAVMFALPNKVSVVANIAPKHYGVSARAVYDEDIDVGQEKFWDGEYDQWRVSRMTWYIEKEDDLERARKIEFAFYLSFPPNPSNNLLQVSNTLLECACDDKPAHPNEDTVKNCILRTDLSVIPQSQFKRKSRINREGSAMEWWELHFKLLVTIQSGPMLFSLECGGREYGSVSTEY